MGAIYLILIIIALVVGLVVYYCLVFLLIFNQVEDNFANHVSTFFMIGFDVVPKLNNTII